MKVSFRSGYDPNRLDESDWIQIEMAARGCVSGSSDEWPLLVRAILRLTGDITFYPRPAIWLKGYCLAVWRLVGAEAMFGILLKRSGHKSWTSANRRRLALIHCLDRTADQELEFRQLQVLAEYYLEMTGQNPPEEPEGYSEAHPGK